jgi:hypothetical protein
MARLVHSRGDLEISIQGIDVEGNTLRINGVMGVWRAKILLSPEEVAAIVSFLFKPQVIHYILVLPWRRRRSGSKGD